VIVCHCKAVSDRAIREAIQRGAQTPREVAIACQAGRGRQCGGCVPLVRELIRVETTRSDESVAPVVAAS
jgi:bacterioferritin-associated ferredoxin